MVDTVDAFYFNHYPLPVFNSVKYYLIQCFALSGAFLKVLGRFKIHPDFIIENQTEKAWWKYKVHKIELFSNKVDTIETGENVWNSNIEPTI